MKVNKIIIFGIIISLLITSCEVDNKHLQDYHTQGLWMFNDYTYKNRADFCLGFVQGAGVSRHHKFIFQIYNSQKDFSDSTIYWKINGKKVLKIDSTILVKDNFFSYQAYTDYYGKKISPSFVCNNETIMEAEDSIFIPPPLDIKILINDSVIYNPNDIMARIRKLSIDPKFDKVSLLISPTKINPNDKTILCLTYNLVRTTDTVKNPDTYKLFVENPKDNIPSVSGSVFGSVTEVNRYIYLENNIEEFIINREFFKGLTNGKGFWIRVYRGHLQRFIYKNKSLDIFSISADGKLFTIKSTKHNNK